MVIKAVNGKSPQIPEDCYVAENATIVGDVSFGKSCSVWFNAVVRGDVHFIKIGDKVNIQDGAIIHCTYQKHPTIIDKLSKSLEKGNVVPILIRNDSGKNEKLNATLFPQMNKLNLYDEKMKRVNITQSLSNGVSTEQKKTEHISQYNNSRKP